MEEQEEEEEEIEEEEEEEGDEFWTPCIRECGLHWQLLFRG